MPRYYFDVHDGADLIDPDGTVLPDAEHARVEATKLAAGVLGDGAEKFWTGAAWKIAVRDETGGVLFTLVFAGVYGAVDDRP